MYTSPFVNLFLFYGTFLIVSGLVSVIFIGMKAKTALISGSTAGGLAFVCSFLFSKGMMGAAYGGWALSFALFIVFSWRATKTLFRLVELIPAQDEEMKGKAIAFLIISLMAVVSLVVFLIQFLFWNA